MELALGVSLSLRVAVLEALTLAELDVVSDALGVADALPLPVAVPVAAAELVAEPVVEPLAPELPLGVALTTSELVGVSAGVPLPVAVPLAVPDAERELVALPVGVPVWLRVPGGVAVPLGLGGTGTHSVPDRDGLPRQSTCRVMRYVHVGDSEPHTSRVAPSAAHA